MSQALYRKYRPKTFDEVYGQTNIVNILKKQIANNRISHAYLFSGTRGTGKTSCAKIFSRAVNCLNPTDGNPCNECANCKAILEESTMDVVEMDAASNRRIDDIRQLRDTVIYSPTDLKFKVYIIDEAHMITNEGFNALLKIMEEPPKHLIFILATTEVDKIPDTILSRTQRFEFKKIDEDIIEKRIEDILSKETVTMDQEAINTISNLGKGSMRDALSVLDQVISIDAKTFDSAKINEILGIVGEKIKVDLLKSVLNSDYQSLIGLIDHEIEQGKDAYNFIKEITAYLELLLDIKIGSLSKDAIVTKEAREIASKLSLDRIVDSLDILIDYELKIKKSDNRNLLLKMSMIRLIDHTPKDSMTSMIKALDERLSKIETGGLVNTNKQVSEKKLYTDKAPVSISGEDFFQEFGNDLKEEIEPAKTVSKNESSANEKPITVKSDLKQDEESEKAEEDFNKDSNIDEELINSNPFNEEKELEQESKNQEDNQIDKSQEEKKANNINPKSLEHAIRNYALKKFPSSKKLFEQVEDYKVNNEVLTYYVNEIGLTYAKVMANLFRGTEEAFYKQTKNKVIIKFELVPSTRSKESKVEKKGNIDKMKDFFGQDNIEIID